MGKSRFLLDKSAGYFKAAGVNVMAFDDFYPAGHQSGVSILMHGHRVATNGDIRFEQTPGQWQPTPVQGERILDEETNTISVTMSYPDPEMHLRGFNPIVYVDYEFSYQVRVTGEGEKVRVTVDLDKPIPEEYLGKLCFNLELFPGELFGKPWIMDQKQGIFPQQANGPTLTQPTNYDHTGHLPVKEGIQTDRERLSGWNKEYNPIVADDIIAAPYAVGRRFTVRPDDPLSRFTVESLTADLKLYDGRLNHNNGWFAISSEIPAGMDKGAIEWIITPNIVEDWIYDPVVQTSQVGYHPDQPKVAIIELDGRDDTRKEGVLYEITENGEQEVLRKAVKDWGKFLRYNYVMFDFTEIKKEGLYKVVYGDSASSIIRIAEDIYDRGVWQPVLEYFLPVQMCHMRVNEKYRVWHDLCHDDDARMAPVNYNHYDGYIQGPSTLCKYQPGDSVPGLNVGGWHDAGDFDLRVESQAGESFILSCAFEEFGVNYDATTIDQERKITEIHQPDGKNDILQQIEHGLLTVVGGWKSLGRLYRGIICNDLRQYVLLGDAAAMTKNIKGDDDDRWVFTEDNPFREFMVAAWLAASARAMRGYNDALGNDALDAAKTLFDITKDTIPEEMQNPFMNNDRLKGVKLFAASELFLTTGDEKYRSFILENTAVITEHAADTLWFIARSEKAINDEAFSKAVKEACIALKKELDAMSAETPYGIPYRPKIWGAGWDIQRLGFQYYFLHKAYPDVFGPDFVFNALNFVLGCHPGLNTASFASGVGAKSATVAYGLNRADWSYIPGGVVSGTALIRPDFPELLVWPYLWQQTEYVLGGGSSNYMFLVLAAQHILKK